MTPRCAGVAMRRGGATDRRVTVATGPRRLLPQLVMSLFGALAAFLAVGAERHDVVRRRSGRATMYLYSLPHGSFGTVDFFQYGPFQLSTPGGAVISACRPSCVVG